MDTKKPAPGQDDSAVVNVPPVVIEASPLDRFGLEAVRIESLDQEDFLVERPVRMTPDALRPLPGVGLQRTGPGQASPYIRGFTGFRTLFVLDGFRFNNPTWREGPNQYLTTIDPELLDSMDLRFGSGGVRFGPDAIGGTLVMESRRAGPLDPDREHDGLLALRYASAERSLTAHGEAGGRLGDRATYRLGYTQRAIGDIDGGRHMGEMGNTSYDTFSGDAKFTTLVSERTWLTVAYQGDHQDDVPRTHQTMFAKSWRGTTTGDERRRDLDQDRDFFYARLLSEAFGPFDRVRAGVGYHVQSESRRRVRSDGRRDVQGVDVDTIPVYLNLENTVLDDVLIRYGVDADFSDVDSFQRSYDATGVLTGTGIQGPVADDSRYTLLGAFVEAEHEFAEGWIASGGVRLAHGDVDADRVADPATGNPIRLSDDWTDWSGEARLLRRFNERWESYVAGSRVVRMPNLSDLTRFDSARSNEIETPSPGLDEETYWTVEWGVRHQEERYWLQAAAFWTWIDGMIVRFPTGNTINGDAEVQKANSGDGHMAGIEAGGGVQVHPQWTVRASATYTSGMVESPIAPGVTDDEPLSRIPPLHGEVALRWDSPTSSVWAEGVVDWADEADRLDARDEADTDRIPPGGTPGYTVFSIYAGFDPTETCTVSVGVENLTNVDYRLHGSGLNEPGTNAILAVRWRF